MRLKYKKIRVSPVVSELFRITYIFFVLFVYYQLYGDYGFYGYLYCIIFYFTTLMLMYIFVIEEVKPPNKKNDENRDAD